MQYDIGKLKQVIVSQSTVSSEDFDRISENATLADVIARLLKQKLVKEVDLNQMLTNLYGIKYVDISSQLVLPEALKKVPKEFSIDHEVIVFGQDQGRLQVAMTNPHDLYTIEYIRKRTNQELEIFLTDRPALQSVIKGYKSDIQNLFSDVISNSTDSKEENIAELKDIAEGVPITKAVNSIIEYAVSEGASDIHIEPIEKAVIVRFRIDGMLHDIMMLHSSIKQVLVARIKIMADLKIDEHRRPQDGRIKMLINDLPISLRVSILPTHFGEKIVTRILDESTNELTLKDLGFQGRELAAVEDTISRPDGMMLVTGPTGSGKTTTLYTVLKILNRPEVNINTVEDPIEYSMPRINQTQVNADINVTFANGLRALLRQDPDIIMVGEIRDEETASMAINAALTGHLVLSTLHTNDAPSAIPRYIDMGAEPFLLASTLNLVIAQRLVRKLCKECKIEAPLDDARREVIVGQLADLGIAEGEFDKYLQIKIHAPQGCAKCNHSGYKGRMGIYEIMEITDKIRDLIIARVPVHELRNEMINQGHLPMFINGLNMVNEGTTSLEEVIRVAKE